MHSVEEAVARILAAISPVELETVALRDALGRVLASDVLSPIALPPWDNSSMDGYAVRAADVLAASAGAPVTLDVLETVAAGTRPTQQVRAGTAIRVMTGAPVPAGADTVIRVEDTDRGVERVAIRDARDARRNVRPRGEDLRAGALAVAAGTTLGPAQLGVLASVGAARVDAYRSPRIALLTTGDELVDVDRFDEVRKGERIVSSNSYTLRAAILAAGGAVLDLGISPDDPAAMRARLESARGCDLLITSGGVSVGDFDYTKSVVESLGGTLELSRVRMRPGAPLTFGRIGDLPWIGLPGNPVSSMVTFELFARPAIRKLRGERLLFRRTADVRLAEPVNIGAPLMHFLRAIVGTDTDGQLIARLTGPQGSGLLTSMSLANALVIVPPERQEIRVGEQAKAILFAEECMHTSELHLT
jgi:molybdopterin molybdotransferase